MAKNILVLLVILYLMVPTIMMNVVDQSTSSSNYINKHHLENKSGNCCPTFNCYKTMTAVDYLRQSGFIMVGNIYYYFSNDVKTWIEALQFCQSKGTNLAYPLSATENNNLKTFLKANYSSRLAWFIGANDINNNKQFVWTFNNSPVIFKDFAKNEPNNVNVLGVEEHCLTLYKGSHWKWNDMWCDNTFHYICQADLNNFSACPCLDTVN